MFGKYKKRKKMKNKKKNFNKKCCKISIWMLNYLKILGNKDKYFKYFKYITFFIFYITFINIYIFFKFKLEKKKEN